jgi:hypothetical protein
MKAIKALSILERTTVGIMVACAALPATAGIQGSYMNTGGTGKAIASVTFNGVTTKATSPLMNGPCAAVNPQSFSCSTPPAGLPPGTPSTVFCQVKGAPNNRWSVQSAVAPGASADDPQFPITITPSLCPATISLESSNVFTDVNTGYIVVRANVSEGSAVWLRGFEYPPDLPNVPYPPESVDDLVKYGIVKWDTLLVGPFDSNPADGCPTLSIPFTLKFDKTNLFFVIDTESQTVPFVLTCHDVTFCGSDLLQYPDWTHSGGCGNVTVSNYPAANLLPFDKPTTVTATATDENGNTTECKFTATRQSMSFDGFRFDESENDYIGGTPLDTAVTLFREEPITVSFNVRCGDSLISTGTPTLTIEQDTSSQLLSDPNSQTWAQVPIRVCNQHPPYVPEPFTFVEPSGPWRISWDATCRGVGIYRLTATLQDGTQRTVIVSLDK